MKKKESENEPFVDESGKAQVRVAVEGCVVDWKHSKQVNPVTKQEYDFDGNFIA